MSSLLCRRFSGEGSVDRSHGSSNVRQEPMVVVNHADELLQGLHGGGCQKGTNSNDFFPVVEGRPYK